MAWHAIHAYPVVTRTHRHNGHCNLICRYLLLNKESIHHLMHRTITAYNHNVTIAITHSRDGKFRNMVFMLRKDQFVRYIVIADEFGNQR